MQGSCIPFARTHADRERLKDPRPSVAERYANREQYLERVNRAAQELANRGYLLKADIAGIVEQAATRWDYVLAREGTR